MSVTLNSDQQAAADAFFEFLLNDDEPEIIISGPGGVGKTVLMGYLIDNIIPQYLSTCKLMDIEPRYTDVEMTATTNKAAAVLGEATKRPTSTIYSFLNLVVKNDYSTGRSSVRPSGNWRVHQNVIIFIDECSYIDSDLLKYILQGTHECKIVYVGDHCQLAPVMESLSPIYRRNLRMLELKQPMRTTCPHLMGLNNQLRTSVESLVFNPIKIVPGIIDWLSDEEFEDEIANNFQDPRHESRILAYTNERVLDFNDHIHDLRGNTQPYVIGETLVSNSAIKIGSSGRLSIEQEVLIVGVGDTTELVQVGRDAQMTCVPVEFESMYGVRYPVMKAPLDRNHFQDLIKYAGRQKDWTTLFGLKEGYPDLRQRDASTFHKSQGSSYQTVYIDATNLSKMNKPDEAARALYVACSRARKRVCFHGSLTEKYGGLVR
jgi:hypothetical protein